MADDKLTGRVGLKSFFQAGDIPEERHFEALINSGINQADDGIRKNAAAALQVQAPTDDTVTLKDLIQLFDKLPAPGSIRNPRWRISLDNAQGGLLISQDSSSKSFFIRESDGFVGIGTDTPVERLQVDGVVKATAFSGLIQPESGQANEQGIFFKGDAVSSNARIQYYAQGSGTSLKISVADANAGHIFLNPSANVGIGIENPAAKLDVAGGIKLSQNLDLPGTRQIRFTNEDIGNNLKIQLWSGFGLGINPDTLFYAANGRHSWRDVHGANERMVLRTAADGGLEVKGTGMSSFAGALGVGKTRPAPGYALDVQGVAGATAFSGQFQPTAGDTAKDGILFPSDPGGGSGDRAWIRYYARAGERTNLEIGVSNDADDHITLKPSGNVGIGLDAPTEKLEVKGAVKAAKFYGQFQPADGNTDRDGILFPGGPRSGDYAYIRYYARVGQEMTLAIGVANNANDHIALLPSGNVGIGVENPAAKLDVAGGIKSNGDIDVPGAQRIRFTNQDTSNNLKIQLWSGYGLGINPSTLFYAANGRHSWRDADGVNERMALSTAANGGLEVKGAGISSFAGVLSVGKAAPTAGYALDVQGKAQAASFSGQLRPTAGSTLNDGILFPSDPGGGSGDAAWIRYYARAGEQTSLEIGTSNDADDHITLKPAGNVGIGVDVPKAKLDVAGGLRLNGAIDLPGAQRIRFADQDVSNNLKIQLWSGYGLGINSSTLFYAANGRHSWRDANGTNERMALETAANGGLAVKGTGDSSFAGRLSVGKAAPADGYMFDVRGKAQAASFFGQILPTAGSTPNDGILFPGDPDNGSGDVAWIRYYARAGEQTNLEIGVSNDADDHITLKPSGNVGIGLDAPTAKLDVNGTVKAHAFIGPFSGQVRPSAGNSDNDGIVFPRDPGGGSGDAAWIRYYARSGESTTFEIGTSNDADDHIVLRPNRGNVGIGNGGFIPTAKLDVDGPVKATGFRIGGTTLTEDDLKVLKSLANDNAHVHVNIDTGILGISTRGTAVIHVPR
ncbi:MAG: hypothetical protein J5I98_28190 [Phaeodactylibacter sp.]|nr:hypothetical protein [Phaeodactylibacter sp.]